MNIKFTIYLTGANIIYNFVNVLKIVEKFFAGLFFSTKMTKKN